MMHSAMLTRRLILPTVLVLGLTSQVVATDCSAWNEFSSSTPGLEPLSIPVDSIQDHINGLETSEGVIFDVESRSNMLWFDIVYVPDNATVITGLRAVMQMGRLVSGDFDAIVLADEGQGVYQLPEPILREIGCQFVWGEEGGQNPIYLIRLFFENLEAYETGQKSVQGFTGHLIGDTSVAMEFHNGQFANEWLLSALE